MQDCESAVRCVSGAALSQGPHLIEAKTGGKESVFMDSKFEKMVEKGFEAASEKMAGLEADRDRLREEVEQLHALVRR